MRTAAFSDEAVAVAGRSYGGRSAAERDAERRTKLLAAALEVIGTQGYPAATVERICTQAGVSTRHFYLLYATKEDAFIDVYGELMAQSYEQALIAFGDGPGRPMAERVAAALIAYLGPMFADPRVARLAFVEIMGVSPRVEELRISFRERLIELVVREGSAAVKRGEIAKRDFRFAALALVGAANAIVYDWMIAAKRPSARDMENALANLALALLIADPGRTT
jgi:AcrR family transcriptional regulator